MKNVKPVARRRYTANDSAAVRRNYVRPQPPYQEIDPNLSYYDEPQYRIPEPQSYETEGDDVTKKGSNVVRIRHNQQKTNLEQIKSEPEKSETDLETLVHELNKKHAHVLLGGKHRIAKTTDDPINPGREIYTFIELNELKKFYQDTYIEATDGKVCDHITAWAKHPNARKYMEGVVFKPYAPNVTPPKRPGYFNTWRGLAVDPVSIENKPDLMPKLDIIKQHIEEVVCNNNPELIEYFYNWVAYTFQKPEEPAGSALVLRGEKGCGKGAIGHFLRSIWGNHGLHISNPQHFVGKFNAHLAGTCFLFADEAFYSADKQHESVLKALITESIQVIERKGVDGAQSLNCLKVFMATNSDWAVPASRDERRYCVFDVSSKVIGDHQYFDDLFNVTKNRVVQAIFLDEMLRRDISDFSTNSIPETEGLMDQRMHSMDSIGKWLLDCLNCGYFICATTGNSNWKPVIASADLMDSYHFWCRVNRVSSPSTQTAVGSYLSKLGFKSSKNSKGNMQRNFGSLEEAISIFENYEKVSVVRT